MPPRAKGARLWLRPAREGHSAVWIIKDGGRQKSTGCGPLEIGEAEEKLAQYIASKRQPRDAAGRRDPSQVFLADIVSAYLDEVAETHARPGETRRRFKNLIMYFKDMTLGELNGSKCRQYAAHRGKPQAVRRELEDLRSAINHFFADDLIAPRINIVLPDKAQPRERWLTRSEAARLLLAAWRKSQPVPKGKSGEVRYVSRHIARFILVGLYTGTRAGAICGAAIRPTEGRGYVDLEQGVFYRRPRGAKETTKRRPPVALPEGLLAHIRRWAAKGLCDHSIVEWCGEPVLRVSKGFRVLAESVGLGDVTPHTLRHTAVTWAMQDGVDMWAAADYFGMTVKILETVYGHHHPGTHAEVIGAVRQRRARRLEKAATRSPPKQREQSAIIGEEGGQKP